MDGDLARQVVVDAPGEAGRGNRHGSDDALRPQRRTCRQHDPTRDDGRHAPRDAAIEVFLEDEPREQRSEHALQIQDERGRGRVRLAQAEHEQERPDRATGDDGSEQPAHVCASRPGDACLTARSDADSQQRQQAQAGTQVEKPGEKQGRHFTDKLFRQRRTEAEENRRAQRGPDIPIYSHSVCLVMTIVRSPDPTTG
jgi:hypothetical protein